MEDWSGLSWLIIDVLMVAALAVAIVYGAYQWRHRDRSRRTEERRDKATREAYDK